MKICLIFLSDKLLARTYKDKEIAATPCDATARWKVGKRWLKAAIWNNLVPEGNKPGGKSLRCIVIVDPKYKHPLVLVTTLAVTAYAVWCLYFRDLTVPPGQIRKRRA